MGYSAGRLQRILIYCRDSTGFGGFRRCRKAAVALIAREPESSALILTGSPLAGRIKPADRVDFVRLPGRTRRPNGRNAASQVCVGRSTMEHLRASIIEGTARSFSPDMLIIDGVLPGIDTELALTVALLRNRGTPILTDWP